MAQKIGLIAGNGKFPFLVAQEIRKKGDEVIAIGLKEETDPSLAEIVNKIFWIHLGELQKLINSLVNEKIKFAIMAGQVKHSQLLSNLKMDFRILKVLGKLVNKKTDTILSAIADEFEKDGIKLLPSHAYLKHLLPDKGLICGKKLTKEEQSDVDFGYRIAKSIAGLDIGQTVAVKNGIVLAVESIEGTDECIKRAATYGKERIVVVKVAKPNQDFRFDIPVIGPQTIKVLAENKARILAIESDATLMIDKDKLIGFAKENEITIIAF